ncbi:hypothetical protein GCM10029964_037120 [Kibdelosporangium lantanae]
MLGYVALKHPPDGMVALATSARQSDSLIILPGWVALAATPVIDPATTAAIANAPNHARLNVIPVLTPCRLDEVKRLSGQQGAVVKRMRPGCGLFAYPHRGHRAGP